MPKFRKKPIVIDAFLWEGDDMPMLNRVCGRNWGRADAHEIAWTPENDGEQVVVWNTVYKQWLCVPKGFWIIRGTEGELSPCEPNVFAATYDPVTE